MLNKNKLLFAFWYSLAKPQHVHIMFSQLSSDMFSNMAFLTGISTCLRFYAPLQIIKVPPPNLLSWALKSNCLLSFNFPLSCLSQHDLETGRNSICWNKFRYPSDWELPLDYVLIGPHNFRYCKKEGNSDRVQAVSFLTFFHILKRFLIHSPNNS